MDLDVKPPMSMERLPVDERGLPVPHVASWTSEVWGVARFDPLVKHVALFTRGRQGRGVPVFDVLNEGRQRRAMMERRCGVCDEALVGGGFIPLSTASGRRNDDTGHPIITDPPTCRQCGQWALRTCPGLAQDENRLLRVIAAEPILQMMDPSLLTEASHTRRFGGDVAAERDRLGVIARREGGIVGYVRLRLTDLRDA